METATTTDLYGVTADLEKLWKKAESLYRDGNRNPEEYFGSEESEVLSRLGLNVMDVYDFVEDFLSSGDPDFGTFVLVSAEKILYLRDDMVGRASSHLIKESDLPPKTEEVQGIVWLPRILVKAKAKLRGELPPEIMYGCGGDRRFLRSHGIHPAEFLRKVRYSTDDQEVVDWVAVRANS